LLDAEVRAIKKAVRSLDAADKHIQAKEAEKAIAEANRAKAALEGLDPKTVSKLDEYRSTLSRLATAYLDLGATIKGMDVLDRFTKAFAEDVPGAKLRIAALRRLGRTEEALAMLDGLVSTHPNDLDAHLQRKELLLGMGRRGEALQALFKALEADPLNEGTYDLILEMTDDRPLWLGRKASALIQKDRAEAALFELDTALGLAPQDLSLMMLKVKALEALGQQEEAEDLLDEVLQRDPTNKEANLAMARKAKADGKGTEAVGHYKNVLRSDPECTEAWAEVAALLQSLGRSEESLRCYDHLKEVMPDDLPTLKGRMSVLAAMKDLPGLDAAAKDVLRVAQNDAAAHLSIIDTFLGLGAEEEADAFLENALGAFPRNLEVLDRRRALLSKRKRYQEAIALCEAQLAIKADHLPAFQDLGQAQAGLGNVTEAIRTFERGLRIWPEDLMMLEALRECFKRTGRDKDVAETADRLLRLRPNDKAALFDRAVALDRLGRKEEAVGLYAQVLALDPNDGTRPWG